MSLWQWTTQWLFVQFDTFALIHDKVPSVLPITAFIPNIYTVKKTNNVLILLQKLFDSADPLKGPWRPRTSMVHSLRPADLSQQSW